MQKSSVVTMSIPKPAFGVPAPWFKAPVLDGNPKYAFHTVAGRVAILFFMGSARDAAIKSALDRFTFAPNDADTWAAVVSVVSSFLDSMWSQGGLIGNSPSESYTVACGLGSTMSAQGIVRTRAPAWSTACVRKPMPRYAPLCPAHRHLQPPPT